MLVCGVVTDLEQSGTDRWYLERGLLLWTAACSGRSNTSGLSAAAFIGRALDKYGEISRGEIMFLCQLIRPGMTVVEVGANISLITVPFARLVAPGGKVIAFRAATDCLPDAVRQSRP